MNDSVLAADFKTQPYWWEEAPRPEVSESALPKSIDVAVIGSGYTGLSASLTLARAGRETVVFEKDVPGYGASSRNLGYVGKTLKHGFGVLLERHGPKRAVAVYEEVQSAYDYVTNLIEQEDIPCHLSECGRFMGALSPAHYEAMGKEIELRKKYFADESELIPRSEQHTEIGSDVYCGGALIPDLGGLHPGAYQLGLLKRAQQAGVMVHAATPVSGVARQGSGFRVQTPRGYVDARNVLVATNGYTGGEMPWFQRRVVPFRGFIVATEPLEPEVLDRVLPRSRTFHDYNHNINALRRSPDGTRILFCGLTGTMTDDLHAMGRRLHARLSKLVPDLENARISHAWNGFCAGTFDLYPHIGEHEGVHYAMGYCFAGIPMGTYLGQKAAMRIIGSANSGTVFDELAFETRPFYWGKPWFLPGLMAYYNWLDRRTH